MKMLTAARSWSLPATLVLLAIALALAGDEASLVFRYERHAVEQGEWWRLLTGHLPHLGWSHLGLNLAGLILVWLLVGPALRPSQWWFVLAVSALVSSAFLFAFMPSVHWYVGLSGVLHGLLLAGAVKGWRAGWRDAPLLILLVGGKLLWEQIMGPLPGSAEAAGGPVVVEAHLYGALGGIMAALLVMARQHIAGKGR